MYDNVRLESTGLTEASTIIGSIKLLELLAWLPLFVSVGGMGWVDHVRGTSTKTFPGRAAHPRAIYLG